MGARPVNQRRQRQQALASRLAKLIKSGITNRLRLAELCGKSVSTIQRSIPADRKRTGHYTTGRSIRLTSRERAVIEGGLLGDGMLIKNPRGAAFEFDNTEGDVVDWVAVELGRLVARDPNERYVQSRPVARYKAMSRFRTATWKDLDALWARWYQRSGQETVGRRPWCHSRKQIPDDFRLTPLSGRLWYLGDGSLVRKSTRETSQVISFATHGFPLAGLKDTLKPQLVQVLRCRSDEVAIRPDPRVNGYPLYGHAITIPARYVPRWLRFIGPCPEAVSSYRYKWDYREGERRRWLADELDILREYWGRIPHGVICAGLGVTLEQARYAAQRRCGVHRGYSNSGRPLRPRSDADQRFQRELRATKRRPAIANSKGGANCLGATPK
jgi:hypothetical protein